MNTIETAKAEAKIAKCLGIARVDRKKDGDSVWYTPVVYTDGQAHYQTAADALRRKIDRTNRNGAIVQAVSIALEMGYKITDDVRDGYISALRIQRQSEKITAEKALERAQAKAEVALSNLLTAESEAAEHLGRISK